MNENFSGLRAMLFPIHGHELRKFLPMAFMMFFILFNYNILRDTKDTLVVNAAGAEALSLIKLIGTVPGAIIILLIYSKLSNLLNREQLFYVTLVPFIVFFALFGFLIYPYRELLHPSKEFVAQLTENYPRFKTLFYVYGSWSYALFYVLSELWGSVIISLLFWQFANDHVKMQEAKRFYPLFGMVANVGLIFAGLAVTYFSQVRDNLPKEIDAWGVSLNYLMSAVFIAGLMTIAIYWWMSRNLVQTESSQPVKKTKLSLKDSFLYLIKSKHLGFIALLVICYGVSINLLEGVWKDQIKRIHTGENAYNAFMGSVTLNTGIITIISMLIGSNIVRIFGWKVSALMTPLMILVTGALFFAFVSYKQELAPHTLAIMALSPTAVAVWLGFFQNILSKSTKYSLFDPTKEMAYIPLDQESKMKGKAAVDVVGGRVGKSGGAFVQQFLLIVTGSSLVELVPSFACIILLVIGVWIFAVGGLNRSLHGLQQKPVLAT